MRQSVRVRGRPLRAATANAAPDLREPDKQDRDRAAAGRAAV